jgi:uncharacterized protein YjbI with pentapeptide repeats
MSNTKPENPIPPLPDVYNPETVEKTTYRRSKPLHDSDTVTDTYAAAVPRQATLSRIMQRDISAPPYLNKRLTRADIEQLFSTTPPEKIDLRGADLRELDLSHLNLSGIRLGEDDPLASDTERRDFAARLDRAHLANANLSGAIAPNVTFTGANLQGVVLTRANLMNADLAEAYLANADLKGARLTDANFTEATLVDAILDDTIAVGTNFSRARMRGAYLSGADLGMANLIEADLRHAAFDEQTHCGSIALRGSYLNGIRLRDMDLTVIDWSTVPSIGEEVEAHNAIPNTRVSSYRIASRTYRRLSLALGAQGLSKECSRFAAKSRNMDRRAIWFEYRESMKAHRYFTAIRHYFRWINSLLQKMVTSYGEHPGWALGWAVIFIFLFAGIFNMLLPDRMTFEQSILVSASALLGHGYASLPTLFSSSWIIPSVSIFESILGSVLLLLFVLALSRKTIG